VRGLDGQVVQVRLRQYDTDRSGDNAASTYIEAADAPSARWYDTDDDAYNPPEYRLDDGASGCGHCCTIL
jgi:hypothetical protein